MRKTTSQTPQLKISDFEDKSLLILDDDDPLSFRSLSIWFIGIIIALLTILVPLFSVLIENSMSQEDEVILKKSIKKDGP